MALQPEDERIGTQYDDEDEDYLEDALGNMYNDEDDEEDEDD